MNEGWRTREEMEAAERATLAPFAQKSGDSRGRKYPEPSHAYRTEFQRDRARTIHSRAFRRLEYKTQVFLNGTGDHLRTRLTHSIEVASISRTIARALGLNEDLAEAIALARDPPARKSLSELFWFELDVRSAGRLAETPSLLRDAGESGASVRLA